MVFAGGRVVLVVALVVYGVRVIKIVGGSVVDLVTSVVVFEIFVVFTCQGYTYMIRCRSYWDVLVLVVVVVVGMGSRKVLVAFLVGSTAK